MGIVSNENVIEFHGELREISRDLRLHRHTTLRGAPTFLGGPSDAAQEARAQMKVFATLVNELQRFTSAFEIELDAAELRDNSADRQSETLSKSASLVIVKFTGELIRHYNENKSMHNLVRPYLFSAVTRMDARLREPPKDSSTQTWLGAIYTNSEAMRHMVQCVLYRTVTLIALRIERPKGSRPQTGLVPSEDLPGTRLLQDLMNPDLSCTKEEFAEHGLWARSQRPQAK